jgi:hypothetical protein
LSQILGLVVDEILALHSRPRFYVLTPVGVEKVTEISR